MLVICNIVHPVKLMWYSTSLFPHKRFSGFFVDCCATHMLPTMLWNSPATHPVWSLIISFFHGFAPPPIVRQIFTRFVSQVVASEIDSLLPISIIQDISWEFPNPLPLPSSKYTKCRSQSLNISHTSDLRLLSPGSKTPVFKHSQVF